MRLNSTKPTSAPQAACACDQSGEVETKVATVSVADLL